MVCCLRLKAITWTNVDLSSVTSCGIHLRPISHETRYLSLIRVSKLLILKITNLKLQLACHISQRIMRKLIVTWWCCMTSYIWIKLITWHLLEITKSVQTLWKCSCFAGENAFWQLNDNTITLRWRNWSSHNYFHWSSYYFIGCGPRTGKFWGACQYLI